MSNALFSVVKHYRNGSEPMFIQEDLTYDEAKKIVNSFPDSQETIVTLLHQEELCCYPQNNHVRCQQTKETHFGIFDGSGCEYELAECTGIDVETLENLKGEAIQILCDATGDDEYFDVVFLNYYDEEEQPLVINALSKMHITFE